MSAYQVVIELGHRAIYRDEPTAEGFTHDWTLFVCGTRKHDISHFVDRVVFYLHNSFKSPKRVIKNPPYEVSESGYGSFECRIDVYFRNKGDPRKLTFMHDLALTLDRTTEPIVVARCEKITFHSPSEEFAQRILFAGGTVLGETSSPASSVPKSKHSSSHRKSVSHAPATTTPTSGRSSIGTTKPSTSSTPVDQSGGGAGVVKGKNICIVEPQSSKAMAVVAPLMAESPQLPPQFTQVFGAPVVKSDASRKHHHHQKDKKKSLPAREKSPETTETHSQSDTQMTSATTATDPQNTDSPDHQRLVQKRLLEASLFGEEDDSPVNKKPKPKDTEDSATMKDRPKVEKKHDNTESKALKLGTEISGDGRRSVSKTPEPTSSKHVDDSRKSEREKQSKQSSDVDRHRQHHSHSKHRKSSHQSTKQMTMPSQSERKSATTPVSVQPAAKDEVDSVKDGSDIRRVSPLKLMKTSLTSVKPSSALDVDMKKLFGDDDDDDDDDGDTTEVPTAAAATVPAVTKDDTIGHKDDHKLTDVIKKHTSHSHKKTPDKSSKSHPPPVVGKGSKDKPDTQSSKAADHRSSSHGSDKHRQSEPENRSAGDATKSSGKPTTKPDFATVVGKPPDSASKSAKVSDAVKKKKDASGDLSLSDSDDNHTSESGDVEICEPNPDKNKQSSVSNHDNKSQSLPSSNLSKLSQQAKAANGEYISVLLDLQKRLMSVADDEALEKLTTMIEETGKYSITDDTFDFDLCRLDIQTVNKLKHFLAATTAN